MTPYVGITDFTEFSQVQRMEEVFRRLHWSRDRKLHVGVMMSYKTLHNLPTKWSAAFPAKENVQDIFRSSDVFNCLHYADYDGATDWKNLARAISLGGPYIDGLQLDMIWPEVSDIANAVHASQRNLEVILQVNTRALEHVQNDPDLLVERLEEYKPFIRYVLLDKSMGQGKGMDATALLPYARALRTTYPDLGIAVAGGLGPDSMSLVEPIVQEFPDVSIDAQGQLRTSGNALDPIEWDRAAAYLSRANRLFAQHA